MVRFFERHPGTARGPLGCGRALVEFLDWLVSSGRIGGDGASPWWSALNGHLVLDLATAGTVLDGVAPVGPATGPVAAWVDYARTGEPAAQGALWRAHQASLDVAAAHAGTLLAAEPASERSFAALVLDVVADAADHGLRTDDGRLGELARRTYPSSYPVTERELGLLVAELRATGPARNRPGGPPPGG